MVAAAAAGVVAVRELNCIITWLSFFPLIGIRQYNNKMASLQTVDIIHKHTHSALGRPTFSSRYNPDCFFSQKNLH